MVVIRLSGTFRRRDISLGMLSCEACTQLFPLAKKDDTGFCGFPGTPKWLQIRSLVALLLLEVKTITIDLLRTQVPALAPSVNAPSKF